MRIHIVRHGDPNYVDDALTPLGHKEAAALAEHMQRLPLLHLYSSPMGRAQETAQHTAEALALPVEVLDWIHEPGYFQVASQYPGFRESNIIWNLPARQLQALEQKGEDWVNDPSLPEDKAAVFIKDLAQGTKALLERYGIQRQADGWFSKSDQPLTEKDIAIFCHQGAGLAFLGQLLQIPAPLLWRTVWYAPTSVTTVLLEEQPEGYINPKVIRMGEITHLHLTTENPLTNNTSGLLFNQE